MITARNHHAAIRLSALPTGILLLMFLASNAAGAANPSYAATYVQVQGTSAVEGQLGVISVDGWSFNDTPPPKLEIRSRSGFRVEDRHQEVPLTTFLVKPPIPTETHTDYVLNSSGPGTITNLAHRPNYNMFIAPLPGNPQRPRLEMKSSDSWEIRQSHEQTAEQPAYFDETDRAAADGLVVADVRGSQRITDKTGGRTMTIEGAFVAIFWDWDLLAQNSSESVHVTSGKNSSSVGPLPEYVEVPGEVPQPIRDLTGDRIDVAVLVGEATYRQTYVFVADGVLRFEVEEANWNALHLYAERMATKGSVTLNNATPLDDLNAVPENLQFQGYFGAKLAFHSETLLEVRFLPGPDESNPVPEPTLAINEVTADQSPLVSSRAASSQAQPGPMWRGLWLVWPAVAALAMASPFSLDRRRFRSWERLMDQQDYATVAALHAPKMWVRRYVRAMAVMQTVALLRIGKAREASALLSGLDASHRPESAVLAYLQACVHALLGETEAAARRLGDCLREEPAFEQEVLHTAWFKAVMEHPLVSGLLGPQPNPSAGVYA